MLRSKNVLFFVSALALALTGLSCQTTPTKPAAGPQYFFYPEPPNPPRVQFLRAFSSRKDIGQKPYGWVDLLVGPEASDQDRFMKPYGIAVDRGRFYVCDTIAGTVWVANFAQGGFQPLAGDQAQGKLKKPINIKIDPSDGRRYVADVGRRQVVVFGPNDQFITAFGVAEGLQPNDVAISGDRLYVAVSAVPQPDPSLSAPGEIQIRDKRTGELGKSFGSLAASAQGEGVGAPTNLAIDARGNILATDGTGFRILIYSPDGEFVSAFGQIGRRVGEFARPKGIAVDRANRIYVVDAAMELVFIYNDDHQPLMWFGDPDSYAAAALILPAQVAIDYENIDYFRKYVAPGQDLEFILWVTSQDGPRLIGCYGFLRSTTPQTAQE